MRSEAGDPAHRGRGALDGQTVLEVNGRPARVCRAELLCPKTAWERFCLYHRNYDETPLTYLSEYHQKRGENRVDRAYLERCCVRGTIPEYRPDEFRPLPAREAEPDLSVENMRYRVLERLPGQK